MLIFLKNINFYNDIFKIERSTKFLKEHNFSRFIDYKPDHSKFGGIIYEYDFGGKLTIQDIFNRMSIDNKFDKICKQKKGGKNGK